MKKSTLSLLLSFIFILSALAQQSEFSVKDIIDVKTLNSQTLSPDGTWLAGIILDMSSRFGTDHFRFRDPSYLNQSAGSPVLINTQTGEQLSLFNGKPRITGLTWTDSGKRLYFLEQRANKLVLAYFDMENRKLKYPKMQDDRLITNNIGITVLSDDETIMLGVRKAGWMEKAMAEYKEATSGPIVVYDGNQDLLKWDQIGATSDYIEVVSINAKTGQVKDLLPESAYSAIRVSKNDRYLSFDESIRIKTSYKRNDGVEYQMSFIDLINGDSARIVYEKTDKRRRYFWDNTKTQFAWVDSGQVYLQSLTDVDAEPLSLTQDKAFEDEEKKKAVKFDIEMWHRQGEKLLLTSKKGWWTVNTDGSDLKMIYELPKEKERKMAPERSVVMWSEDSNYLYTSYSEKDQWKRGIQRYNIAKGEFEDIMTNTNLYTGWRFADNSDVVTYNLSDGDKPNNLYANTLSFDSEKKLTDLNPWVVNKKWTKSELISYRDVDGIELKGILYYPVDYDATKSYPLVIEVYEKFFDNGYRSSMNLIANQGYFGLRPSVDLEQGYPGEAWVKGVTSAINKLVDEGKVDNDKVGIHGTSYGGYATSLLITQTDRFAAAINISGKVNIISFLGDSPKIGTRNYSAAEVGQDRIGGSFWDQPLKYFQTTAVLYADRIKTPHLLLTGEGDWNVPGTNTRELYYAMRRLGKDVTWVNYMRGGHGAGWASVESDYYDQWQRMLDFYKKHFFPEEKKGDEENDESASEQY